MRITVAWLGKTKEAFTRAASEEYLQRMLAFRRIAQVSGEELTGKQPEAALLRRAAESRLWLLDPAGCSFTSPDFARWLEREAATRPLLLAVGAADGFSPAAPAAAAGRLSLSPLTLPHELARVVLLEQLYRALAILTGHPYPH